MKYILYIVIPLFIIPLIFFFVLKNSSDKKKIDKFIVKQVNKEYTRFNKFMNNGSLKFAERSALRSCKRDKKDSYMACSFLGDYYRITGCYEKAEFYMYEALKINDSYPVFYYKLIDFYIHIGKYDEAKRLLDTLREKYKYNPVVFERLGNYYFAIGRFDTAIEYLKKARKILPSKDIYYKIALSEWQMEKRKVRILPLRGTLKSHKYYGPEWPPLHRADESLMKYIRLGGSYDKALQLYEE